VATRSPHSLDNALTALSPKDAATVLRFVDDRAVMDCPLTVVEQRILQRLIDRISTHPDYLDRQVQEHFNLLLVRLVKFLSARMNLSPVNDAFRYLVAPTQGKPLPTEFELQKDMFDFLCSSGYADMERPNVSSGRADIFVPNGDFRFVIEVKRAPTARWSWLRTRGYIKQAAAYHATDIRLGFLAVLDLSVRDPGTPHFDSCMGVISRKIGLSDQRMVIAMRVPANRRPPNELARKPKRGRKATRS
jgi:hypothetical protein